MTRRNTSADFWARVEKTPTCWLWRGKVTDRGYGVAHLVIDGQVVQWAHRIAYILENGPIPEGLELDHLCRNPQCVKADHLEAVDHYTNCRRGSQATQTHCINGHALTEENLVFRVRRDGSVYRQCRECCRLRSKGVQMKTLRARKEAPIASAAQ